MEKFCSLFSFIVLILHFQQAVQAQSIVEMEDSIPAVSQTISYYMDRAGDDLFIYEGREYASLNYQVKGHAFFESNNWQEGSLMYKGQFYPKVSMLYDLAAEEVVVKNSGVLFRVKLYKDKVDHFSLLNHHFVNIGPAEAQGTPLVPGFYDRLYNGNVKLFVKRKKTVKESIVNMAQLREFVQKNLYFIEKGGEFYPVKSKGAVLKVLKDQKKEIRRHLKKNKIWFKKNPEEAILTMVEFYDQAHSR